MLMKKNSILQTWQAAAHVRFFAHSVTKALSFLFRAGFPMQWRIRKWYIPGSSISINRMQLRAFFSFLDDKNHSFSWQLLLGSEPAMEACQSCTQLCLGLYTHKATMAKRLKLSKASAHSAISIPMDCLRSPDHLFGWLHIISGWQRIQPRRR